MAGLPQTVAAMQGAQPGGYVSQLAPEIQELRQRIAAGYAPQLSPEEIEQRRAGNRRDYALGILGKLSGDEMAGDVGGHVLKQALAMRTPHMTERGTGDPLTGEFKYNAGYLRERDESKLAQLQEREAQGAQSWQSDRQRAAEAAQLQANMLAAQRQQHAESLANAKEIANLRLHGAQQKTPVEIQRMNIGFGAFAKTLDEYERALQSFNPRSTAQADMTHRANLASLHARLMFTAKEAAALGALTGPDVGLLTALIASPVSPEGVAYGREGLQAQIRQARAYAETQRQAAMGAGVAGITGAPAPAAPLAVTPGLEAVVNSPNSPYAGIAPQAPQGGASAAFPGLVPPAGAASGAQWGTPRIKQKGG